MLQDVFSIESKDNRCKCSSCRLRGQRSKLSYRHAELGAVKVRKKSYERPRQHIQKQRHYFATKVHLVKAMVFPVVMYGCESWTVKKAEHRRMDAFELWCWRRLLRVSWTAGRSNQSIQKEISPGISLEEMMLKLKPQYFGHLMWRVDSGKDWCWEGLGAGGEGDNRGWDDWMASQTQWAWVWASSRSWWLTGKPGVVQSMGLQNWTWLSNWSELTEVGR